MSPRGLRSTVLLASVLFGHPSVSFAEEAGQTAPSPSTVSAPAPAAEDSDEAQAREKYREGVQSYAAGRFADAIERFRAADRRIPSAALSFDMARAYEKLGDDAGALRSYRDYLRRARDAEDAAEVRELVGALSRRLADRGVQQVTVLSSPAGATVVLDGEPMGVTPYTTELPPGRHTASVHLDGHEDATRAFVLPANDPLDVVVSLEAEHETPGTPAAPLSTSPLASRPGADRTPGTSRPLRTLGIVAVSAGGAALGGALVFELLRRDSEHKADHEQEQIRFAEYVNRMQSERTTARVLGGVGAGLAAIGGVLLFTDASRTSPEDTSPRVKLDVSTTAVSGAITGKF